MHTHKPVLGLGGTYKRTHAYKTPNGHLGEWMEEVNGEQEWWLNKLRLTETITRVADREYIFIFS